MYLPPAFEEADTTQHRALLQVLIGLALEIETTVGKWKLSQNRPAADRQGVIAGRETRGDSTSLALAELDAAQHRKILMGPQR